MIARVAATCSSVVMLFVTAACATASLVPIDTSTHATLDMSAFRRVLVAGFIGAGTAEVDTNVETVRLLRAQLRTNTELKVIDADILPLAAIALDGLQRRTGLKDEKDLDACRHVFADVRFWKRLGEEYGEPLIITGTVLFRAQPRGGSVEPVFLFIDGRTGVVIYSASFRESLSHGDRRRVPALSTYFQLMDRLVPNVLGAVSDQAVRGSRTLLR